jgi:hypothetical protein
MKHLQGYNLPAFAEASAAEVPRTGIEPALPCGNQILSLTRLPIPPSGLYHLVRLKAHARNHLAGGNITHSCNPVQKCVKAIFHRLKTYLQQLFLGTSTRQIALNIRPTRLLCFTVSSMPQRYVLPR